MVDVSASVNLPLQHKVQVPSVLWHCWLGGRKGIRACKNGGRWRWALVNPDGVAPSRMVVVSASVNLPLRHKVRSSLLAPAHPGGPGKRAVKRLWCGCGAWGDLAPSNTWFLGPTWVHNHNGISIVWDVDSGGYKEACIRCECTLVPPGECDWTIHLRQQCGLFVKFSCCSIIDTFNKSDMETTTTMAFGFFNQPSFQSYYRLLGRFSQKNTTGFRGQVFCRRVPFLGQWGSVTIFCMMHACGLQKCMQYFQ